MPLRTTARITALSPGQSPPPVSIPIRTAAHRTQARGRRGRRAHATAHLGGRVGPMARRAEPRLGPRAMPPPLPSPPAAPSPPVRRSSAATCARSLTTRTTSACARPWAAGRCGSPRPTAPSSTPRRSVPTTATPIVLAHGWTEQLAFWGPVIKRLRAQGLRVVAYDLRGHGRSEPGRRRRLCARALRRGSRGGAGRGGRGRRPRAGHRGRPLAGGDVDRRLGRAPRSAHAGARRRVDQHRAGRSHRGTPAAAADGALSQPPAGEPGGPGLQGLRAPVLDPGPAGADPLHRLRPPREHR